MKNSLIRTGTLLFLFGLSVSNVYSKPELPALFSSNMVFQQKTDAPIWGKAEPGKQVKVTASWNNKSVSVNADASGAWKTTLKTPSAGGPYTVTITDGTSLTLSNVMVGEVWICSGQSNMEMPLGGWAKILNYEQEIANAKNSQIRLFQVRKDVDVRPSRDVHSTSDGWNICSPQTVADFSSVAYFYARELQNKLKIPVGVINVSWGGTIAEAWTSAASLEQMPDFVEKIEIVRNASPNREEREKKYQSDMMALDKGYKGSEAIWVGNDLNDASWSAMNIPSFFEDVCLPNFDGVVWLRRQIELNDAFLNGDLQLSLGPIDDEDICFFNGMEIGRGSGYTTDRLYTIPQKCLKKGTNILTIRVSDTGGGGGMYGEKEKLFVSNGSARINLAGVWKYQVAMDNRSLPATVVSLTGNPNYPTLLFNAMLNPLIPFAMQGAIWYQGESNADRAYQYRDLFPLMIRDWRKHWNRNFPFYFVQLANYQQRSATPCESDWAELREAQLKTLALENTGMAVITDIGDANDIHPKNKQEVGRRLSLIALANTYGQQILFSGPIYSRFQVQGSTIKLWFNHTEGGLMAADGTLKGFTVAGPDHKFYPAKAVIQGTNVIVSSDQVSFPIAVRYAWEINPECSLFNGAKLPASPFRTDDWPGVTLNVK